MARDLDGSGERCVGVSADVLDPDALADARDEVEDRLGPADILVNAAGGNVAGATLAPGDSPFGLPPEALAQVVDLNLHGTIRPTQVFGAAMARAGAGAAWSTCRR